MKRRTALAVSAAVAMLSASAVVATTGVWRGTEQGAGATAPATTAATDASTPSTTTPPDPVVVTEVRDVYDTIVVPGSTSTTTAEAPPVPSASGPPPSTPTSAPTTSTVSSTTTTAPPSTAARDAEVPEDWPADQPIPPMPEGCQEPHLEDNGVWNCGGD